MSPASPSNTPLIAAQNRLAISLSALITANTDVIKRRMASISARAAICDSAFDINVCKTLSISFMVLPFGGGWRENPIVNPTGKTTHIDTGSVHLRFAHKPNVAFFAQRG